MIGRYKNMAYETRRGRLRYYLRDAKNRARKKSLAFDLDLDYLDAIATVCCPIFGTPFVFGESDGLLKATSPSLDRIVPSMGYIKGNVVFISHRANTIKHNVEDASDLYKVADWLSAMTENGKIGRAADCVSLEN
jgi:hypothetical protein